MNALQRVVVLLLTIHGLTANPFHQRNIREYLDKDGHQVIVRRAEDLAPGVVRDKRCECYCNSAVNGQWNCCECLWTDNICFPAKAKVTLEDGRHVAMADLNTGDKVLTVSDAGLVESSEVRVFLHREPTTVGLYTRIRAGGDHEVVLSPSHLIYTSKYNYTGMEPRYASSVETGDYIFTTDEGRDVLRPLRVTEVTKQVAMEGVYVPLTDHGTLLVDDIYTSCYASFRHDWAHAFMAPMRWFPALFELSPDQEGCPTFVRLMKTLGRWFLPSGLQNRSPLAVEFFSGLIF